MQKKSKGIYWRRRASETKSRKLFVSEPRSQKGYNVPRLNTLYFLTLMLGLAFVVVACTPKAQEQVVDTLTQNEVTVPSVSVNDQEITEGQVIVAQVVSAGAGWMVIHADNGEGKPGGVIGQTAVSDGVNSNVTVTIEEKQATDKLFAMLHIDVGEVNTYEFPGADVPIKVDDVVVVKPFNVTGLMVPAEGGSASGGDDSEAVDDSGTSLKVPAPGTDPDSVDEMIVEDNASVEDDGGKLEVTNEIKTFNVGGVNFVFDVKEMRVKKGDTVTINFISKGGLHDWTVSELSAATARVNSGASTSVTFVADKAGTFEYFCSVGNHRAQGMIGNLIVE